MGFFSGRWSSSSANTAHVSKKRSNTLDLGPSLEDSHVLNSRRLLASTAEVPDSESSTSSVAASSQSDGSGSSVRSSSSTHSDHDASTDPVVTSVHSEAVTLQSTPVDDKVDGEGRHEKINTVVASPQESRRSSLSSVESGTSSNTRYASPDEISDHDIASPNDNGQAHHPITVRRHGSKSLKDLTYGDAQLSEEDMRADISEVWKAMHLFLNSRMIEAEDICLSAADHRLYFSVGYTLIQCIKSLMTFEPEDLEAAVQCCKDSLHITNFLRKKDHSFSDRLGSFARGTTSVASIKSMTVVQRHAELVYAECLLLKAVIGIIYSGDFLSFLKEALNMRSAYAIYRTLAKFVEDSDLKAKGEDLGIDTDFRSGVALGNGLISLILSLLPSTVLKFMEVFGFSGDRDYALRTLMTAGKWTSDDDSCKPGMKAGEEGLRRQVCDMALLFYHLVISTYLPVTGVDINVADKILHYNLKRYPDGVFFLYFSGRLYSTQTQCEKAVKQFHFAIQAQREYIQLQHICHWDLALTFLALGQFRKAYECFNILDKESNWSKAIYAYAKATTLYETGEDSKKAAYTMQTVPDLMQRIAGKSIPLEKFVARKSRKFVEQGGRLMCPGIELAYVLNVSIEALGMAPRFALFEEHLEEVSTQIAELHKCKDPTKWGKTEHEYWDDYCLAHLLRGIILRFIAYPEPHADVRPMKSPVPQKEAEEQAMISFNNVFKHGREICQDHHIILFAHFELGRLYSDMCKWDEAEEQFNMVMTGKGLEVNKKSKGKISLQNQAILRTNAALDSLKQKRKQVM